jgi:DNA-binding transcriptional ArsR family regulator
MTLDAMDIKVKLIKGFGDKTRLQILECIKNKEKTVSQIVEEIKGNQSNISQHLACLKGCGIIVGRQEGKFMYYGIRNERIKTLLSMFDRILDDVEKQVADCDKNDQCLSDEGMNCNVS